MATVKQYYRYEANQCLNADEYGEFTILSRMILYCYEFNVVKETPKGVRLDIGRLVLHNSLKKYACATKQEALVSFIARKKKHLRILKQTVLKVEQALQCALDLELNNATAN